MKTEQEIKEEAAMLLDCDPGSRLASAFWLGVSYCRSDEVYPLRDDVNRLGGCLEFHKKESELLRAIAYAADNLCRREDMDERFDAGDCWQFEGELVKALRRWKSAEIS